VARQEIARVLVGDRQWVAVDPIARAEVALEVGGPEIIRVGGRRRDHAGMLIAPPAAALLDQSPSGQEIAGGADGRPRDARAPRLEPREEFGRPPARMVPARCTNHRRDVSRDAVPAAMRCPAAVGQGGAAPRLEAREPFVAGVAADAVPGAEFSHGVQVQPVITNESLTLFHG
jgi:hypothetical protein